MKKVPNCQIKELILSSGLYVIFCHLCSQIIVHVEPGPAPHGPYVSVPLEGAAGPGGPEAVSLVACATLSPRPIRHTPGALSNVMALQVPPSWRPMQCQAQCTASGSLASLASRLYRRTDLGGPEGVRLQVRRQHAAQEEEGREQGDMMPAFHPTPGHPLTSRPLRGVGGMLRVFC